MPGADDHAACDAAGCHRAAFVTDPGPLCRVCHTAVDPTGATPSPLRAYPATDGVRAEPSRFSHAVHLDRPAMEAAVGFNVACADCHEVDGAGRPTTAGHRACARCHADEVGLPEAPAMSRCADCHVAGATARTPRRLIVRDVRFDHGRHATDARGAAVRCSTCHLGGGRRRRRPTPPGPAAGGVRGVPRRSRACPDHQADAGLRDLPHRDLADLRRARAALAPAGHRAPRDHTLAFRRDHAARPPTATALRELPRPDVGRAVNACDECHQVMRPAITRWCGARSITGPRPSSIAIAARPATSPTCTACHQQRPRSHGPSWASTPPSTATSRARSRRRASPATTSRARLRCAATGARMIDPA
jgi:hypothetical protein